MAERRSTTGGLFYLCTDAVSDSIRGLARPRELISLVSEQINTLGNQSLGLITASSLALGGIMAIQFGNALQRYGGTLQVPVLVGLSLFRELGPMLTSLLLAGRIGSGITAEVGSMSVTEQVDAVRALGDSPGSVIVLPRILACFLAFPILVLFANFVSFISAMLISWSELGMSPTLYFSKTVEAITWADLWTGIVKAMVFGFFTGVAGCWKGLNTTGGTRAVGFSTTWIVVRASIFILIADFFLGKLFILTVFKRG